MLLPALTPVAGPSGGYRKHFLRPGGLCPSRALPWRGAKAKAWPGERDFSHPVNRIAAARLIPFGQPRRVCFSCQMLLADMKSKTNTCEVGQTELIGRAAIPIDRCEENRVLLAMPLLWLLSMASALLGAQPSGPEKVACDIHRLVRNRSQGRQQHHPCNHPRCTKAISHQRARDEETVYADLYSISGRA